MDDLNRTQTRAAENEFCDAASHLLTPNLLHISNQTKRGCTRVTVPHQMEAR
jgi:hypothetical protein